MVFTITSSLHQLPLLPPPPDDPVLTPLPPLLSHPLLPDWVLTIIGPVIAYWALSITFEIFDYFDLFSRYRLHTPEEVLQRNRVGKKEVAWWVFIQQVLQMIFAYMLSYWDGVELTGFEEWEQYRVYLNVVRVEGWMLRGLMLLGIDGVGLEEKIGRGIAGVSALVKGAEGVMAGMGGVDATVATATEMVDWRMAVAAGLYSYIIPAMRFWLALFILDTWQYFLHRLMHTVPELYRAIHSHHHRLYCPYAFGALYNHPLEGFLMDTIGAGMAFKISGMGQQGALLFFVFSTLKTVDDHCGYKLPWDPLQWMFWNNAEYHDVHHQSWGIKTNFSQPFFICWDRWLDTQWNDSAKATSERYRKGREAVERMVEQEKAAATAASPTSSVTATTTTVTPAKENGAVAANGKTVVMNGAVEKIEMERMVLLGGGGGAKALRGVGVCLAAEEDSGWDDNSSDGSGEVSLGDGAANASGRRVERELRNRRAATAR
ncbi:fatty acid hydroxylase superfamily-domain-containing protein [Kalaharituber pfeilii]|nr:fatty acid hydroxylase superfamily-domain-containing protein [Kalaharituber pfeilii]